MSWQRPCTSFSVISRGSQKLELDYEEALGIGGEAFALWQSAACPAGTPSLSVLPTDGVACEQAEFNPEGPNANVVTFRESAWEHSPLLVALTHVTFSVTSGEILDVDMEINVVDYAPSRQFLRYVVAHEAGHFFGLDHTNDDRALMSPFYATVVDEPALLNPDDVAGICATYPPNPEHAALVATCDPLPRTGFSAECGGDVEAGCTIVEKSKRGAPFGLLFGSITLALLFLRVRSRALIDTSKH